MKKMVHIVIMLCSAAIAVIFGVFSVLHFSKMQTNPEPLKSDVNYADAEGTYISFEASYPIASWVDEYYSGDPDRVRSTGYVIYDVIHDTFVCTIVLDEKDPGFGSLMRGMQLPATTRAGRDMMPITINGFLERATPEQAELAEKALDENDVLKMYIDFMDSDGYMKSYFEDDEYGITLGSMCQKLLDGNKQTQWYVIKQEMDNLSTVKTWLCFLTACLNALIFLFSVVGLLRSNRQETTDANESYGSLSERFLAEQKVYAADWCTYNLKRAHRLIVFSVVIPLVICIAIAFLVKSTDSILSLYFPLGLLIGEIIALILWSSQTSQSKPDKILKNFQKYLTKELPNDSMRNEFMQEYVNTEPKWIFHEKTHEGMIWGKAGERYWSFFSWTGRVTIVEVSRLNEVETETVSGTVNNGTVRVRYESYVANFYYQYDNAKRKPDKSVSFNVKDNLESFIELARKRVGNSVAIMRR